MNLITQLCRVIAIVGAFLTLGGCKPIDAAFDCGTICKRYKDCFDGQYNEETCASRCRTNAEANTEFYRSVDVCEACMTDRACASATFTCGADCSRVVP